MDPHSWNLRYRASERLWPEEPNQFVVSEVGSLPPGSALDVACGEGRNAIWLAERGWEVVAVDFSSVALARARERARARGVDVTWVLADVLSYRPAEAFDLVLVSYLQLPELRDVIERIEPYVGGTLLIVAHARANLRRGYGGPQDPAMLFEPEECAAWISELSVTRAEHVERVVDSEEGPRQAIDFVLRAVRPALV